MGLTYLYSQPRISFEGVDLRVESKSEILNAHEDGQTLCSEIIG